MVGRGGHAAHRHRLGHDRLHRLFPARRQGRRLIQRRPAQPTVAHAGQYAGLARQLDQARQDGGQLLVVIRVEILRRIAVHPAMHRYAARDQGRAAGHAPRRRSSRSPPRGWAQPTRCAIEYSTRSSGNGTLDTWYAPSRTSQLQLGQLGVRPPAGVGDDQQLHRRPRHAPRDLEAAEQAEVVLARLERRAGDDQPGQRCVRIFLAAARRRRRRARPAAQDRAQFAVRAHVGAGTRARPAPGSCARAAHCRGTVPARPPAPARYHNRNARPGPCCASACGHGCWHGATARRSCAG